MNKSLFYSCRSRYLFLRLQTCRTFTLSATELECTSNRVLWKSNVRTNRLHFLNFITILFTRNSCFYRVKLRFQSTSYEAARAQQLFLFFFSYLLDWIVITSLETVTRSLSVYLFIYVFYCTRESWLIFVQNVSHYFFGIIVLNHNFSCITRRDVANQIKQKWQIRLRANVKRISVIIRSFRVDLCEKFWTI